VTVQSPITSVISSGLFFTLCVLTSPHDLGRDLITLWPGTKFILVYVDFAPACAYIMLAYTSPAPIA